MFVRREAQGNHPATVDWSGFHVILCITDYSICKAESVGQAEGPRRQRGGRRRDSASITDNTSCPVPRYHDPISRIRDSLTSQSPRPPNASPT